MVIVPVKGAVLVLPGTVKPTVPSPLPVAPSVIVINGSLLIAIQSQVVPKASSFTVLEPPFDGSEILLLFNPKMQFARGPWLTVNVCPPIDIVPVRALVLVLEATV